MIDGRTNVQRSGFTRFDETIIEWMMPLSFVVVDVLFGLVKEIHITRRCAVHDIGPVKLIIMIITGGE